MQVSQVAYDRFVLELPPADATWRPLADPEVLAETAAWLWNFGPKPLIAVVGIDRDTPKWLASWKPRAVRWAPTGSAAGVAVVLAQRADLERFLSEGAPHEHTVLLWPRDEHKTFDGLNTGQNAWLKTVEAHAAIQRAGEVFEVNQIQG
jgi:hypothetical protein